MSDLASDLAEVEAKARSIHAKCNTKAIRASIDKLSNVAINAGLAHSCSWIGYHSCVYYNELKKPATDAFFDSQWGLEDRFSSDTVGDWVYYQYADIYDYLKSSKVKPSLDDLANLTEDVSGQIDDIREELFLTIEACLTVGDDGYLKRLKEDVDKARMRSPKSFSHSDAPAGTFMTNDHKAMAGGIKVPPHIAFYSIVKSIESLFDNAEQLAKIANRAGKYIAKRAKAALMLKSEKTGTRVFIGHGRSKAWLVLKNYMQDRLDLTCDDFNREATAGTTTVSRLSTMLDEACFAFLVLTGEDCQKDGSLNARMNVIHEVGLFQGKLGFEKAIVMLEKGCQEFSNIHGLTYISFEKEKIKSVFHEVSDTLKRERVIP